MNAEQALAVLDSVIQRSGYIVACDVVQARAFFAALADECRRQANIVRSHEAQILRMTKERDAQAEKIKELELKAAQWDSLIAARAMTSAQPETAKWKAIARNPLRTIEAIKDCRAENGLSLREARDCVEAYIASLREIIPDAHDCGPSGRYFEPKEKEQ